MFFVGHVTMSAMPRFPALVPIGVLLVGSLLPTAAAKPPEAGDEAIPFVAETLRRTTVDSDDLRGKVVVLQFWASWCASCIDGMPALYALYDEHSGDDFEIVGISLDEDPRAARRVIAEFGLSWPQICDGQGKNTELASSYEVSGTPRFVLVGRDGRVHAPYVRPSELESAVSALLDSE